MKNKFNKAPLSSADKEIKAEEFINFLDDPKEKKVIDKNKVKKFLLHISFKLFDDLKEISLLTGTSVNAVCRDLLKHAVKNKLKEVKEFLGDS